jgi:hypothetical protein
MFATTFSRLRRHAAATVLVAVVVLVTQGVAPEIACGQAPAGYYTGPIVYSSAYHFERVYQGSYWYWSPEFGWHLHHRYTYVAVPDYQFASPSPAIVYPPVIR